MEGLNELLEVAGWMDYMKMDKPFTNICVGSF